MGSFPLHPLSSFYSCPKWLRSNRSFQGVCASKYVRYPWDASSGVRSLGTHWEKNFRYSKSIEKNDLKSLSLYANSIGYYLYSELTDIY